MFDIIFYGVPVGLLLSLMAGPIFFLLIETSIIRGIKSAVILDLGILSSDIICIYVCLKGSEKIMELIGMHPIINLSGGIIIISYGLYSFFEKKSIIKKDIKIGNNIIKLFFKGFILNFFNVSIIFFWTSVIISTETHFNFNPITKENYNKVIIALITIMITYVCVDFIKIYISKKLGNRMNIKNMLILKKIIGMILFVLGSYFLSSTIIKTWF